MRLLTPISGRLELTMARPSSKTNSGLQTELHTVSSPGRSRELKSTVKSGGMAKDVTPTGDVLSVKPLKYETETRLALSDWFVTDTTVADRIGPPVCEFMYVTR